MQITEKAVVKQGEELLRIGITRINKGLAITTKSAPTLEAFVASLSGGQILECPAVSSTDRKWEVPTGSKLYALPDVGVGHAGVMRAASPFRMDRWGYDLLLEGSMPNLSFLRLKGLSEGDGVTVIVRGVYSLEKVRETLQALHGATKSLYLQFIRPINCELTVVATEL